MFPISHRQDPSSPLGLFEDLAAEFEAFINDYVNLHNCFGIDRNGNRRSFIPRPALTTFWSEQKLSDVLSKWPGIQTEPLNDGTVEGFLAVFSIVVLLRKNETLKHFMQAKLNDQLLPFNINMLEYYKNSHPELEAILPEFIELQWQFCPHSFGNGSGHVPRHTYIRPGIILPILRKVRLIEHGYQTHGLATVYKVELHPLCGPPADNVVLKEYHEGSEDARNLYEAEWYAYSRLKSGALPSITTCYGSFEFCGRNALMLEYAPGGTLLSLFEENRPPANDWERERLWTGIFGLLEGLPTIHDAKGPHKFIRPQSVVVCSNASKNAYVTALKFADMGTHFRERAFSNTQRKSHGKAMTRIPNVDTSRTSMGDLWDVGAISSEALIWSVFGEPGRIAYKNERIANNQLRLFDIVERWHNRTVETTGGAAKDLSQFILELLSATNRSQKGKYTFFQTNWRIVVPTLRTDDYFITQPGNNLPCWPRSTQPFRSEPTEEVDGVTGSGLTTSRGDDQSAKVTGTTKMDLADNESIRSSNDVLDSRSDEKNQRVIGFSKLLYDAVRSDFDADTSDRGPGKSMLSLLQEFSVKLAVAETTDDAKEFSIFVEAYCKHIVTEFERLAKTSKIGGVSPTIPSPSIKRLAEPDLIRGNTKSPTPSEKVSQWDEGGSAAYDDIEEPHDFVEDDNDNSASAYLDDNSDGFSKYKDHLATSEAFVWLVNVIKEQSSISWSNAPTIAQIREAVVGPLERTANAQTKREALFRIPWQLQAFSKQQGYPSYQSLEGALTLSGSSTELQLLPCLQYARQCWPRFGEPVVKGLISSLKWRPKTYSGLYQPQASLHLLDDTTLSFETKPRIVTVKCNGTTDSIAEVAIILSWLASSLREGESTHGITYITPTISLGLQDWALSSFGNGENKCISYDIGFRAKDVDVRKLGESRGICWRGLLGNPVVANGFPVLSRKRGMEGLEMPLSVMTSLLGADYPTSFRGQLLLKGFNAAVVPRFCTDATVLWHLVVNENGDRLPYTDGRISALNCTSQSNLTLDLGRARHILGWTPNASHNIGSATANYDKLWADPGFSSPEPVLEKVIFQLGMGPVTCGTEFAIGKKDPSATIVRGNTAYLRSIEALLGSYVVLYDTRDHRAWLSNGASALLHLTRASLRHSLKGHVAAHYVCQEADFVDQGTDSSPQAAVDFLCDMNKLRMPILRRNPQESEVYSSFGNRVEEIMRSLEQLLDYQVQVSSPGKRLRLSPRGNLEGYSFMQVATRRSIAPCAVTLKQFRQAGKSWVDFTRAINAVTLFGKGFGELIAPVEGSIGECSKWQTLPKGKDFLGVSTYDLERILDERGDAGSQPPQLAPGIVWHRPSRLFEECACGKQRNIRQRMHSCDRVQVLLPQSLNPSRKMSATTVPDLTKPNGAVIFGRSPLFPFRWPEKGDPEPDSDSEETTDNLEDAEFAESVSLISSPTQPTSRGVSSNAENETSQTATETVSTVDDVVVEDEGKAPQLEEVKPVEGGTVNKLTPTQRWKVWKKEYLVRGGFKDVQ